jgi:archaellum component FlaG (FlaF/FlaG flagellin family)
MTNFHNSSYAVNKRVYVDDTTSFTPIYNTEVYNKGAVICHILRDEIGDSLFFGGVTALQTFYKNKNIDVADFKAFMEKYSGKDLTIFFNQWYYGYGYPRFTITYSNNNKTLFIRSLQQGSSSLTPLFKTKVEFLIKRNNAADTTIAVYQSQNDQTFAIPKISDVKSISLDPRNVLLDKVISIKADPTVAVFDEIESKDFNIYPNPVQDVLTINTSLSGDYNVEVCSKNGMNRLKREKITNGSLAIDMSDLSNDYYFVKVMQDKKVLFVKKIVVIH